MKNFKTITFLALALILSSCSTVTKFPISSVTPASDITVKKQYDRNGNTKITVTAKNMAAVERLTPPQNIYVVWVVAEDNNLKNIGQLKNKNAKTAEIETLVPYKFTEIFITAEYRADVQNPAGIEISRIRF